MVIQLRPDAAPNTVERIQTLTRQGFYNGLAFFRVIEGFMAQGGDPQNNGTGGSTLPDLPAEINGLLHVRGAVAMARAQDMNSANSQFYIMFVPRMQMDRQYTVFGRVVSGMNFVDTIERGEPPARAEPDHPRLARHRQCAADDRRRSSRPQPPGWPPPRRWRRPRRRRIPPIRSGPPCRRRRRARPARAGAPGAPPHSRAAALGLKVAGSTNGRAGNHTPPGELADDRSASRTGSRCASTSSTSIFPPTGSR